MKQFLVDRLKILRPAFLSLAVCFSGAGCVIAQDFVAEISLDSMQAAARRFLPFNDNFAHARDAYMLHSESVRHNRAPDVSWNSQGQLQSHVIKPEDETLANFFPDIPHLTFTSAVSLDYALYDGGISKSMDEVNARRLEVENQDIKTRLTIWEDMINGLYYAVLMSATELSILDLNTQILDERIEVAAVGEQYGTVLRGTVLKLDIERDKLQSRRMEVLADRRSNLDLLEKLTGLAFADDVVFVPVVLDAPSDIEETSIVNPKIDLLEQRKLLLQSQEAVTQSQNNVKVQLYATGGVGYPNPLNFLNVSFQPYALGGVRVIVPLFDWNQVDRDIELLRIESEKLEVEKAAITDGVEQELIRHLNSYRKLESLTSIDQEIVEKEEEVLKQYTTMLEEGVLKSHEYTEQLNAVLEAQLKLESRILGMSYATVQYHTAMGDFPTKNR